jgi:hypothetical protein
VGRLVLEYYLVLRSLLKAKPHLRRCRTRCRHCGIFFLTHPRNRGRRDLGCPFGCKDAHRRRRSIERSTAYNRSRAGKLKKKVQNGKRRSQGPGKPAPGHEREEDAGLVEVGRLEVPRVEFDGGVVDYLLVVTSLIEGRPVSREEVLEMLRRAVRQHSFARERRIDYLVRRLKEEPP